MIEHLDLPSNESLNHNIMKCSPSNCTPVIKPNDTPLTPLSLIHGRTRENRFHNCLKATKLSRMCIFSFKAVSLTLPRKFGFLQTFRASENTVLWPTSSISQNSLVCLCFISFSIDAFILFIISSFFSKT